MYTWASICLFVAWYILSRIAIEVVGTRAYLWFCFIITTVVSFYFVTRPTPPESYIIDEGEEYDL